jgi:hypothetical protein
MDAVIFVGIGHHRPENPGVWDLMEDQLMPVRGFGQHEFDLVGIAERLPVNLAANLQVLEPNNAIQCSDLGIEWHPLLMSGLDYAVIAWEPPFLGCTADKKGSFFALMGTLHKH